MTEVAKKTGDYPSLSAVDLKVLALVHDLHVEKYGKEGLNYDCLPGNNECWVQQQQDRNVLVRKVLQYLFDSSILLFYMWDQTRANIHFSPFTSVFALWQSFLQLPAFFFKLLKAE